MVILKHFFEYNVYMWACLGVQWKVKETSFLLEKMRSFIKRTSVGEKPLNSIGNQKIIKSLYEVMKKFIFSTTEESFQFQWFFKIM